MSAVAQFRVVFIALVLTLAPLDRAIFGGVELGGRSALAAAGDNGNGNGGGGNGGGNSGGGNAGGNSGGGNAGGNSGGNSGGGNAGGNAGGNSGGGNAGGNSGGNSNGQGSNAGGQAAGSDSGQGAPAETTGAFGPETPGRSSVDMLRDYRTAVLRNDLAAAAAALAAVGNDELSEQDVARINEILGIDGEDTRLSNSRIADQVRELRTPAVTPVTTGQ